MHADELNTAMTEKYGKPVYHYHLHVMALPVVDKEIRWSKRCKAPEKIGTVKEVVHQVSHSKKWKSEKALDKNGQPVLNSKGKPVYRTSYSILQDQFFDHMSVYSLEAEGLVAAETEVSSACVKVLSAMASGAQNVRDIADRADISASYCSKMLEDMEHKGLVQKEVSSGMSRRAVYTIGSNIIRFFYEVVYRYTHHVEFESPTDSFELARDDIDAYVERGFKSVCMDYVTHTYEYSFIGKLRKKDDTSDSIIDFVASVNANDVRRIMTARCRLHGAPFSRKDLDELMDRSRKIEGSNKMFVMFSGAGFDSDLTDYAKGSVNVLLLSLDDIYRG